jgi:CopG family nickel-responsive transcriptional regulator
MEVTALKGSGGDLQHFADRIFAERGVRYGRVAMIPASGKTERRPKAYLTIETPAVAWSR